MQSVQVKEDEQKESAKAVDESSLVGPYEAARILRVGASTVQRWIDSGEIRAHRTIGGHRRIQMKDLLDFAKQKEIPVAPVREEQGESAILIVDDDTDLLEMFALRIKGERDDLDVLTASNGFQAGYLLNRHRPQLVLLDIRMPGINGVQVCRLIRNDPRLASARVIGMTAYRDSPAVDDMKKAGANHILFKPIEPTELVKWLDTVVPRSEGEDIAEEHQG